MTVRPLLAVAALGLLAAAAAVAVAEPPVKHTITVRERWKAGDVFSRTGDETQVMKVRMVAEGRIVSDRTHDERSTYNAVGRVVEVDAVGHATRTFLYFMAWNRSGVGARDGSLSGVLVESVGRGSARTCRVLTPDVKPTAAALKWLNERFGGSPAFVDVEGKDPDDLYEPKGPLAIGETWAPDASGIAKAVGARLPIFVEKVTVEAKLEAVSDGVASVQVVTRLPLRGIRPSEGSPLLDWKEGGTLETTLRSSRAVSHGFEGTEVREARLEGVANAQGADVEIDLASHSEIVTRAGGTMPAIPAEPATPGAPEGK